MSQMGHSRRLNDVVAMSACSNTRRIAATQRATRRATSNHSRNGVRMRRKDYQGSSSSAWRVRYVFIMMSYSIAVSHNLLA